MVKLTQKVPVFVPMETSLKESDTVLEESIRSASEVGALLVNDLSVSSHFEDFEALMDIFAADQDVGKRLNGANPGKAVFRDCHLDGNQADNADQKSILDITDQRLQAARDADPELVDEKLGDPLKKVMGFFHGLDADMRRLVEILARVIGDPEVHSRENVRTLYRINDYYERPTGTKIPRGCEHRDFGPMTMIFQDPRCPSIGSGLQVEVDGIWHAVEPLTGRPDAGILIFGTCTAWRSNSRITAINHRVIDQQDTNGLAPRRLSAVYFFGPQDESILEPVVLKGEEPKWRSGKAKDMRPLDPKDWMFGSTNREQDDLKTETTDEFMRKNLVY